MSTLTTPATHQNSSPATQQLLRAYLRLLRPANLVTAAADIFTGAVIVGAHGSIIFWLAGASACLYAGGVVLNDFFDRRLDALERPERPIPSGLVPASVAAGLGALLLLTGVGLGFQVSGISGCLAALTAAAILLYDAVAKPRSFGPVVMGSCRALNLLLGLSAVPAMLPHRAFLALLPFTYIVAITTLSRGEVHGGSTATSRNTLLLFLAVLIGLAALAGSSAPRWESLLPFVILLTAKVAPPLWRAFRSPMPLPIRAAVHAGIVSLILLDATLAATYSGILLGAAILSLSVVTGELSRLFPVT